MICRARPGDSVYIDYERNNKKYTLIDTAGIRKRKNIKLAIEKFSIVKTLQAIDDANVVVLLVDAHEGLVEQDMHLMGSVIDAGRGLVVAINKWDGLDEHKREHIKTEIKRRLRFAEFADVHFISALHGTGVGHLYKSINTAYKAATDPLSTTRLTKILEGAVQEHQPPMVQGRRIKTALCPCWWQKSTGSDYSRQSNGISACSVHALFGEGFSPRIRSAGYAYTC